MTESEFNNLNIGDTIKKKKPYKGELKMKVVAKEASGWVSFKYPDSKAKYYDSAMHKTSIVKFYKIHHEQTHTSTDKAKKEI